MLPRVLYRTFRALTALDGWIRRRFTRAGWLLLGGLGASAVVGLDTNRTVAYQAFTFLLAVLLLAVGATRGFRPRVAVRRVLPRFATVGQPLGYHAAVRNLTRQPRAGLTLLDAPDDPGPGLEEFVGPDGDGDAGDNWWDRLVGYPRWQALVRRSRGALIREQPLPTLPPLGEVDVKLELVPLRRGYLRFSGVTVSRLDPLGIFRACRWIPLAQSLLVLPERYPVAPIHLPGTRKFQQGGVALALSVGDSEEFVALRDYRPGDPLRRIHWKSWARVGRPMVREYQDEFFVRQALVLDTFAGPGGRARLEAAVSVAASVACAVDTGESLLDLMFVGPRAYCFTAGRGVAHVDQMLEILASVGACRDQPFAALHRLVAARAASLSACLAVLLAWDGPRQAFVRQLDGLGVPTLVLLIAKPGEAPAVPLVGRAARTLRLEVGAIREGLARL